MIAVAPRLRDYMIFSQRGLLAEMILDIQINDQANERMKTMTFPGQLGLEGRCCARHVRVPSFEIILKKKLNF